jgi:hypothetical protein
MPSNATRYVSRFPQVLLQHVRYLVRRIEELPDELRFNADALNTCLIELNRIQSILGARQKYVEGDLLGQMPFFGGGIDGNVLLIDGGTTTLTRDMYYENLTLDNASKLIANGYRVFVKGRLTIRGDGQIKNDGNNASGQTGGLGLTGATLGASEPGGDADDNAGSNSSRWGGAGGAGGDGSVNPGGTGGTIVAPGVIGYYGMEDLIPFTVMLYHAAAAIRVVGGAGGGAGGKGDVANKAGAGGGGGGVLMIAAQILDVTPGVVIPISAKGGNGSNAISDNAGGGGGGGGGAIGLITAKVIDDLLTAQIAAAAGGTKGLKHGTGLDGVNGSAGTVFDLRL